MESVAAAFHGKCRLSDKERGSTRTPRARSACVRPSITTIFLRFVSRHTEYSNPRLIAAATQPAILALIDEALRQIEHISVATPLESVAAFRNGKSARNPRGGCRMPRCRTSVARRMTSKARLSTLATKQLKAGMPQGRFLRTGRCGGARSLWQHGVGYGEILLDVSLNDILIDPVFPNRFDHGDGVREYALAWDSLAKCANGLHLTARRQKRRRRR